MKNIINKLPDTELEIMKILWKTGAPIKAGDIVKRLADTKAWKRQTVHALLSRLETKGFVSADRSGYFHMFFPIITEEEYLAAASSTLVSKTGGGIHSLLASLINENAISDDEILSITKMLQDKCAEIEKKRVK